MEALERECYMQRLFQDMKKILTLCQGNAVKCPQCRTTSKNLYETLTETAVSPLGVIGGFPLCIYKLCFNDNSSFNFSFFVLIVLNKSNVFVNVSVY